MSRILYAIAALLIVLGLLVVLVLVPVSDRPEGSWGESTLWANPWVRFAVGLVTLALGALLIGFARTRLSGTLVDDFLSREEDARVVEAIRSFERRTSGEIRVHLASQARGDVMKAARSVFERLGMTRTERKNGVLFFVDVGAHHFAVIGDHGIDEVVADDFWQSIVDHVHDRFAEHDFAGGLIEGIQMAGEALAEYFPIQADDQNELPDDISRD